MWWLASWECDRSVEQTADEQEQITTKRDNKQGAARRSVKLQRNLKIWLTKHSNAHKALSLFV